MSQSDFQLDHLYLPAKKPAWLAEWYAETFGFQAKEGFVVGGGAVLVFQEGEPNHELDRPRFGFRCTSYQGIRRLADTLKVNLIEADVYCSFEASDPEGYKFEVYWEGSTPS